jgi:hypothetical protein
MAKCKTCAKNFRYPKVERLRKHKDDCLEEDLGIVHEVTSGTLQSKNSYKSTERQVWLHSKSPTKINNVNLRFQGRLMLLPAVTVSVRHLKDYF